MNPYKRPVGLRDVQAMADNIGMMTPGQLFQFATLVNEKHPQTARVLCDMLHLAVKEPSAPDFEVKP